MNIEPGYEQARWCCVFQRHALLSYAYDARLRPGAADIVLYWLASPNRMQGQHRLHHH